MDLLHAWMLITVLIYNTFIAVVLLKSSGAISLRELVREKSLPPPVETASTANTASAGDTSYSRVSGLAGAVVLSSFVWGLGNVVIYKAFLAPADIPVLLSGVSPFILSASALFAPYAVNQLSSIFKS
jgi:uncharacterized RDD family membrane protein YckC